MGTRKKYSNIVTQLFLEKRSQIIEPMQGICIIFVLALVGCSDNPESYIPHVNGYWEIEAVTFEDGSKKEYKYNETIDYISINDSLKGFRKKMTPGINNTYFTSDDAEALNLKIEDKKLNIYYSTPYNTWKETVLEATPENLRVVNENKAVYLYKRYRPINLDVE